MTNIEATNQETIKKIDARLNSDTCKSEKKCIIYFVGNSTPKEKFEQLKKVVVEATKHIDKDTPWQNTEPQWWLDMMDIQAYCR